MYLEILETFMEARFLIPKIRTITLLHSFRHISAVSAGLGILSSHSNIEQNTQ